MANKLFLSRFTPSRTAPEILEQIFVQREPLAKDAEERLIESVIAGNMHHLLFIGPRGSGKTHLISLIFHRLIARDDLRDKLRIAWLSEDETTTSFVKLLLRIYRALAQRYPQEFGPVPGTLQELNGPGRIELLSRQMVETLQGRALLVVVENLDDLFKGLGDDGEKQWRAFLQENPMSATLATSQQLFDGISRRESPFFGFFQIEYLRPLKLEDAILLLEKIAELNGDTELAAFLMTPTGRSRVRALHHLSGGNHRIYIILSDFITRESLDELVGPFEKLMDELTPYYQARLSWLSPQQREIVEFLCRSRNAVPVKEVANQLLISHQTATGQLKEIKEKGYVQSHAIGREARYELAEPLMRLSIEVKENNRQPIRLVVDFLRIWYGREHLERQLQWLPWRFAIELDYVRHALRSPDVDAQDLRTTCILNDLEQYTELGHEKRKIEALKELVEVRGCAEDWIALGRAHQTVEEHATALDCYNRVIAIRPDDAPVLRNRGDVLRSLGRFEESVESCDRALVLEPDNAEAWRNRGDALFYLGRGYSLAMLDRDVEALECCDRALALRNEVIGGWYVRGRILAKLQRHEEALESFNQALVFEPGDVGAASERIIALLPLGFWNDALEGLKDILRNSDPSIGLHVDLIELIVAKAFESISDGSLPKDRLECMAELYSDARALTHLGVGLIGSLRLIRDQNPSATELAVWQELWHGVASGRDELSFPLRIFDVGIRFLRTRDPRVLLDLVQEEREILASALRLQPGEELRDA
jgi:tetratricopeptide (TPR) repeat protein